MVERRDAFPEMTALQKEISRLFEQLTHFERSEAGVGLGEWLPSFDVFETKDSLVIKVEAPGMTKRDLTAAFQGHKLIVSGEKKRTEDRATEQRLPVHGKKLWQVHTLHLHRSSGGPCQSRRGARPGSAHDNHTQAQRSTRQQDSAENQGTWLTQRQLSHWPSRDVSEEARQI